MKIIQKCWESYEKIVSGEPRGKVGLSERRDFGHQEAQMVSGRAQRIASMLFDINLYLVDLILFEGTTLLKVKDTCIHNTKQNRIERK